MTLLQLVMVWSLRAAVLWGAAELGLTLYDEGLREAESWARIQDFGATMQRLELREREIKTALAPLQSKLSVDRSSAPKLRPRGLDRPEDAVSAVMRNDLEKFGAQGVQVAVAIAPVGGLSHATVDLSWDEVAATAPGVLAALAAKRPYFTMSQLSYERIQGSPLVKGKAQLQVNLQIEKATKP